ncbi:hypothetical protein DFH09DRAFT_388672 [Mycena vulgaris]|nr:hypothetical protein DFH09DRAFT_388672 [Mycena vulgaris]
MRNVNPPSSQDVLESVLKTEIALFMHVIVSGTYMILVALALWSLVWRKPAGFRVLSGLIIAMCVFGTVEMVMQAMDTKILLGALYSTGESEGESIRRSDDLLSFAENLLVVTNNAIADSLLIYRCYVLWGDSSNRRRVVVLLVLLSLATAVAGYMAGYQDYVTTGPPDPRIFFALVVATNLTLTGLTAGRIFFTRRRLQSIGETRFVRRYNTAIKMVLESAVIYLILSLAIIVERALARFTAIGAFYAISAELLVRWRSSHLTDSFFNPCSAQNIIPVLLVVQISFGRTREVTLVSKPEISSV